MDLGHRIAPDVASNLANVIMGYAKVDFNRGRCDNPALPMDSKVVRVFAPKGLTLRSVLLVKGMCPRRML